MKKGILLFFGVFFLLGFAAMLEDKQYLMVAIYGGLSALFFYLWHKEKKNNPRKVVSKTTEVPIESNVVEESQKVLQHPKRKIYNLSRNERFEYNLAIEKSFQILESLQLISTTLNIDTLSGRAKFIFEIYPELIKYHNVDRYLTDISSVIDRYKLIYYDKVIIEEHVLLLIHPSVNSMISYISESVVVWFNNFVAQQYKEIEGLVRENAKQRRIDNIAIKGRESLLFLIEIGKPIEEHYDYIHDEIARITGKHFSFMVISNNK